MENFAGLVSRRFIVQNNISITLAGCLANRAGEIIRAYHGAYAALGYEKRNKNTHILWFDVQASPSFSVPRAEETAMVNKNMGNDEKIDKIIQYIDEHFTNPQISLISVADKFSITEFYLSHLFKEKTGINFSKYLEKLRMEYAQMLLSEKQYKVVDAARETGYGSHQSFGRVYRKYYGKSPSAYNNRPL
jgi:YesN/AraC family two-component response regulator